MVWIPGIRDVRVICRELLFFKKSVAIRLINNSDFNAHTVPLFKCTKVHPVSSVHQLSVTFRTHLHVHNLKHNEILSEITSHSNLHSYSTRNSNHFILPLVHLSKTQNCFLYKCVKLWNILPDNLKAVSSHAKFKSLLSNYLLEQL